MITRTEARDQADKYLQNAVANYEAGNINSTATKLAHVYALLALDQGRPRDRDVVVGERQ